MFMLPLFSFMHFRKSAVAPAQLGSHLSLWDCWAAWGEASAGGAALEPPLNRPPMAWPTEEPMATPLHPGG